MKNKIIVSSLIITIVVFLFVSLFRSSYAKEEDINNISFELYDNENIEILEDNIRYFIDLVDKDIILNSSYNFSSNLNENYDFLTKFAISFVLNNESYFDITYGDNYNYIDDYGIQYVSNKYINIQDIYNVTNKIFGINYYYITDDNLIIDNDMVLLVDFDKKDMEMILEDIINIDVSDNYYDVYVKYMNNDLVYVYRFEKALNNRLYISNLNIEG